MRAIAFFGTPRDDLTAHEARQAFARDAIRDQHHTLLCRTNSSSQNAMPRHC